MKKKYLVQPHGGKLKPLLVKNNDEVSDLLEEAKSLSKVSISSREFSDIIMMGTGSFSPLEGFMLKKDYDNVVEGMHLNDGVLWPIPVTLAVTEDQSSKIKEGDRVVLNYKAAQEPLAIMEVEEKYKYDKDREVKSIFKTNDAKHPGVQKVFEQGDIYIGGKLKVLNLGGYPEMFPELAFPEDTRKIFSENGWDTIAAFQTRNPMHRSHEYLAKIALEICDGLFINPIVGKLKEGDIPADVRMKCYRVLIDNYFPKDRVVLKVYPMEMRYAGPKEAVLHAIIRQNFGCSHLIIGRDHAGVGDYYGPFEAQDIFDDISEDELEIKPLKLDWTFWCNRCGGMASMKTCPHKKEDRILISGTELRKRLARGEVPPPEFTRKEVADILIDYYKKIT
jgi:sulfate adenylyltransferase